MPCGCEFHGILWIRCCQTHKAMAEQYPKEVVMGAILTGRPVDELARPWEAFDGEAWDYDSRGNVSG